jgi:cyanophycinase-like exopeptidase
MEAVMRQSRARRTRTAVLGLVSIALVGASAASVAAAGPPPGILVPIGSDYQADTLELFASQAASRDTSGNVVILVIPITYSLDAYQTKNGERQQNTTLAENRTHQVEDACNAVRTSTQTCDAQLVPVLIRPDAYLDSNLEYFTPDVDGMYVLGGDQTVAMQVVAGTPVEEAMAEAYARGAVLGGNSAGDAVQSRNMINGYTGGNGPAESLRKGAVDVWTYTGAGDETRGLIFGMPDVIADQHVFEYGRTGRSLNVALEHHMPVLGMDAATGGVLTDDAALADITGDTSAYVIDPTTWRAAATWGGPNVTLSARRVAMHLVPPGAYGFDFRAMRPVIGRTATAAPSLSGRTYPAFTTPSGAGRVLLSGGIVDDPAGDVGQRFVALAGGANARIVVLTAGYARSTDAQADAKAIAAALQPGVTAKVQWFVLDGKTDAAAVAAAVASSTGIFLTAPDRSLVAGALAAQKVVMEAVKARWQAGKVLLADDAAAAVLGSRYIADPISPDVEVTAPEDMLTHGVTIENGLDWVANARVEPRLVPDQNWGQAIRLAAAGPSALAVGIDVGTAVEVSNGIATARGASAAVVIDGRQATFGTGTNGSLAAGWMVIDSFVSGETLAP